MKNEERIIELLSEYLRKSDKHEEERAIIWKQIAENQKRIDKNGERIDKNLEELKAMRSEALKNQIKQDVLLKEILNLSKRVNALEDLN